MGGERGYEYSGMIRSKHVDVEVKPKWYETYKLLRLLKHTSLAYVREYVPLHCVAVRVPADFTGFG